MFKTRNRISSEGDGRLVAHVKPSASDEPPVSVVLPEHISLAESVRAVLRTEPPNDSGRRVLNQLRREVDGPHHFFAMTRSGEMVRVDEKTRLFEIAVPRERRTPDGDIIKEERSAQFEVQRYADVGGC